MQCAAIFGHHTRSGMALHVCYNSFKKIKEKTATYMGHLTGTFSSRHIYYAGLLPLLWNTLQYRS